MRNPEECFESYRGGAISATMDIAAYRMTIKKRLTAKYTDPESRCCVELYKLGPWQSKDEILAICSEYGSDAESMVSRFGKSDTESMVSGFEKSDTDLESAVSEFAKKRMHQNLRLDVRQSTLKKRISTVSHNVNRKLQGKVPSHIRMIRKRLPSYGYYGHGVGATMLHLIMMIPKDNAWKHDVNQIAHDVVPAFILEFILQDLENWGQPVSTAHAEYLLHNWAEFLLHQDVDSESPGSLSDWDERDWPALASASTPALASASTPAALASVRPASPCGSLSSGEEGDRSDSDATVRGPSPIERKPLSVAELQSIVLNKPPKAMVKRWEEAWARAAATSHREGRADKWPSWTFFLKDADGKLWHKDKRDASNDVCNKLLQDVVTAQRLYYVEIEGKLTLQYKPMDNNNCIILREHPGV